MRLLLLAFLAAMPAEAAFTLQGIEKPARVTVAATWGTLTLPAGTEYVCLKPITSPAQLGVGCTDGAALGSHYITVAADPQVPACFAVHNAIRRNLTVCLAGTGSAVVEVLPTQRGY